MIDKTNLRIETVNEYCIVNEKNQIVKDGFYSEEEAAEWLEEVYGVKHEPKPQPKIGGWIPCSERLPEKSNSYLVTKHIDETEDNMAMSEVCTEIFWTTDNKWDCERDSDCEWKVTAWRPLPEAYHGKMD